MLWVRLALAWGTGIKKRLETDFEIAHVDDAVDGAFAQFAGQHEDIRGNDP
jgi:hypothetical protein